MKNVLIKVNGALPHQDAEVKNVYVYVDGIQRDRYIVRNVGKLVADLKDEYENENANVMVEGE